MTRSKNKSHKALTWEQRIDNAMNRGKFTGWDKTRAGDWKDCAYGQVFVKSLGIDESRAAPRNEALSYLGCEFTNAVQEDEPNKAASILDAIKSLADIESLRTTEAEGRLVGE